MTKACPVCKSTEWVREYLFGLPEAEPDPSRYISAGCVVDEGMPDFKCIRCSTEFFKNSDETRNRFVTDSPVGINVLCRDCESWYPLADGYESHLCEVNPRSVDD